MSLPTKPQSRVENYLGVIVGQGAAVLPQSPQSRVEDYLDYIARHGAKGSVKNAYFFNNKMWEDAAHTIEITPEEGKIYLAENQHKLYVYQDGAYIAISGSNQSGSAVFTTYQSMVNYVNYITREELSVGSNVYIIDVNVPDLWIAVAETTSQEYTFVSNEKFLEDLESAGHVKVGYYLIAKLEAGTDLSDYYNKTQTDNKFVSKTGEDFTNVKQSINKLKELVDAIGSIGRYLSDWNATTGLPVTNPQTMPYEYETGDYYLVSAVGETNYKPNGASYDGTASTAVEAEEIYVGDMYRFDGTSWVLLKLHIVLEDYVKFTDYAGNNKAGVFKTSPTYGNEVNTYGALRSIPLSLAQYTDSISNYLFISKGTLENIKSDVTRRAITNTEQQEYTDAEKKAACETIGSQEKYINTTISLPVASWSNNEQTVSVTGVTADNLVQVSPAPASFVKYAECGIYCSAQASGQLTFKCGTVPTEVLSVGVVIWN